MSLIDAARDALKSLPISDIIRERLSLMIDRLSDAEAKIEVLQSENGALNSQLEKIQVDYEHQKLELAAIIKLHEEHVRIFLGTEFRKGLRTCNIWMPFCPKCHMPIIIEPEPKHAKPICNSRCGWSSPARNAQLIQYESALSGS